MFKKIISSHTNKQEATNDRDTAILSHLKTAPHTLFFPPTEAIASIYSLIFCAVRDQSPTIEFWKECVIWTDGKKNAEVTLNTTFSGLHTIPEILKNDPVLKQCLVMETEDPDYLRYRIIV